MKTPRCLRFVFLLPLLLSAGLVSAQTTPVPAPSEGYWNLETNLLTPGYTIVRFYNAQNQLVHQERVASLCLNVERGRGICRLTARRLNQALGLVLQSTETGPGGRSVLAQSPRKHPRIQRLYAVR